MFKHNQLGLWGQPSTSHSLEETWCLSFRQTLPPCLIQRILTVTPAAISIKTFQEIFIFRSQTFTSRHGLKTDTIGSSSGKTKLEKARICSEWTITKSGWLTSPLLSFCRIVRTWPPPELVGRVEVVEVWEPFFMLFDACLYKSHFHITYDQANCALRWLITMYSFCL